MGEIKIQQYRYFGKDNVKNYPVDADFEAFTTGSVFKYPIMQLGIQAMPGTKVYINRSQDPVIIGFTGLYEIDYHTNANIYELVFDKESVHNVEDKDNDYIIVDTLYYDEGE